MAVIAKARAMRKALTPAEARLWVSLRALRREGLHFRRQCPMNGYYLDFACLDRRVIVELDGTSHDSEDRRRKDRVRDAVMARGGFLTLRYPNPALRDGLDAVVQEIRERCLGRPTRLALRANHPPPEGEGEDS